MDKLIEILEKNNIHGFGCPGGTDNGTIHNYTSSYEKLLSPFVDENIRLLEIGVQYGGSSLLWHEYLPKAKMVLVDIHNQVHPSIFERMDKKRYDFYIGDAYKDEVVDLVKNTSPEGFDVIIDDGPHSLQSQIIFIQKYLPMLKKGGILIIEDIQDFNSVEILKQSTPQEYQDTIEVLDLRNIKNRYDDVLFIIRK